jgi:hypothetical protein
MDSCGEPTEWRSARGSVARLQQLIEQRVGLLAALGSAELVLMGLGFAMIAMGQLAGSRFALGLVKEALGQFEGGHGTPRSAGTAYNSRSQNRRRQKRNACPGDAVSEMTGSIANKNLALTSVI